MSREAMCDALAALERGDTAAAMLMLRGGIAAADAAEAWRQSRSNGATGEIWLLLEEAP